VDNTLLANAERAEDRPEQIVTTVIAGDFAKRVLGLAQFLGGEFTGMLVV
jgi:hypothetical protein